MTNNRVELTVPWDGLVLAGSLHLPDQAGSDPSAENRAWPTVLMMQGSGPADRDSDGYFEPIRNTFLSRGIATFSFDKPGCGQSSGNWLHYALNGRADQAEAVIDVLKRHSSVDNNRLGIWGQSQGGWLVQMVAGRRDDLAFAIANSGPSIPVQAQDLFGHEHTMRAAGYDEDAIAATLAFVGLVHQAANDGMDYRTVVDTVMAPARNEPWADRLTLDGPEDWGLFVRFAAEDYNPVVSLAEVSCPFLAIFGGRDVLVPAWLGAEETGRALAGAPSDDVSVVVFPTGNHRIKIDGTDSFVDGYLDLLGDWAARRVNT